MSNLVEWMQESIDRARQVGFEEWVAEVDGETLRRTSAALTPVTDEEVLQAITAVRDMAANLDPLDLAGQFKGLEEAANLIERLAREKAEQGRNACELFDQLKAQQKENFKLQQCIKELCKMQLKLEIIDAK